MSKATRAKHTLLPCALLMLLAACALCLHFTSPVSAEGDDEAEGDPPEETLGERLFLETRFSQFFFLNCYGDVNRVLLIGDPVLNTSETTDEPLPGPFKGQGMNCRACHLVDEQRDTPGGGMRTYCDFAQRSPIPLRADGKTMTPRNSPPLVNASLDRASGLNFHFDGQFATLEDLCRATLTGRNYGWLASEQALAIKHIARVIRLDNGHSALARSSAAMSYATLFKGTDYRIPKEFRIDVTKATDNQIVNAVSALIAAYVRGLEFSKDAQGNYNATPYDLFLAKNKLPRQPNKGESDKDYGQRLLKLAENLASPQFVTPADGTFALHQQDFAFGADELEGLKTFLREPETAGSNAAGNCIACHAPPNFTDFSFHNTGVSQEEYDSVHGAGKFKLLAIPTYTQRVKTRAYSLPATAVVPKGLGTYLAIPNSGNVNNVDLGLWNVFLNAEIPKPQGQIALLLQKQFPGKRNLDQWLSLTVALFKTPGLRDLGHSGPYFHSGRFTTLTSVIDFYRTTSAQALSGDIRNADAQVQRIQIETGDTDKLVKFLMALNEDYQ